MRFSTAVPPPGGKRPGSASGGMRSIRAQSSASKMVRGSPDQPRDSGNCSPRHTRSRSEEHTSELQSQSNLVCRLLLEKKKNKTYTDGSSERSIVTSNYALTRATARALGHLGAPTRRHSPQLTERRGTINRAVTLLYFA